MADRDKLNRLCWDSADDSDVYTIVFQTRARPLKVNIDLLRYGGLALPVVGALLYVPEFIAIGKLPGLSTLLAILSIIVLFISIWSVSQTWDTNLAYYYDATRDYTTLKSDFLNLAQVGHEDLGVHNYLFELTRTKFNNRRALDVSYDITSQELAQARQIVAQRKQLSGVVQ